MLLNLHVKNLALIKEVDVDFKTGLIVLTGETGAGKSLLLGSINLALGNKASRELIRTGTDYSLVELTFEANEKIVKKLKNLDVYMEDDNTVVVTRKISEGRSIAKINGETVNLSVLKEVMALLVDIHGQHEHQSLLYNENHLKILDKFAKEQISKLLNEISQEYKNYILLKKKLSEIDVDESQRTREIEFATYEVKEIESAGLKIGEDLELEEQFRKASNSKEIIDTLSQIYNNIGYDNISSVGEVINVSINDINRISSLDEKLSEFAQILYDMDSLCRDLTTEMAEYNRQMDFDAAYINDLEERLNTINHLKIKYGQNIEAILEYKEEKEAYLEKLNNVSDEIENIRNHISISEDKLITFCKELSDKRRIAAKELEKKIVQALNELNFLSVNFKIDISDKNSISSNGMDNVEFMISTNPGEPVKPLGKVASGGELSRIMLAIKSILAIEDEIDTMIFDEIDSGISGITAQMVANKLAKISKNHQVLCISHLAQIAAMADNHYLIEKHTENDSTITNILYLDRESSIKELVRINGGIEITEAAIKHATEMKDMADRTKCN